jgi:hypothetical protein
MDIRFYKTKYSDNIIPIVNTFISYDDITGVMTFKGAYNIDTKLLPQKLVIIKENTQYPLLIEITNILHRENDLVVLLSKVLNEIKSEEEMSTWCIAI